jgi:hypothetical protein
MCSSAFLAFSTERVVHAMSADHAATTGQRDREFAAVVRQAIAEESPAEDQCQSAASEPEHRIASVFPVSETEGYRTKDRHKQSENAMGVFFRGDEVSTDRQER